jgi:hypothetical protein
LREADGGKSGEVDATARSENLGQIELFGTRPGWLIESTGGSNSKDSVEAVQRTEEKKKAREKREKPERGQKNGRKEEKEVVQW